MNQMDAIRETALAYYEKLPESKKQKAEKNFKSLDKNGDGKIDLQEYIAKLNKLKMNGITNIDFFKELDKDGNGSLDFNEVITLFYIIESGRSFISCKECGEFLKGVYFTCVECFNSSTAASFHLCSACYRDNKFQHHDGAVFVDNYALLLALPSPSRTSMLDKLKKGSKFVIDGLSVLFGFFRIHSGVQFATDPDPEDEDDNQPENQSDSENTVQRVNETGTSSVEQFATNPEVQS